MSDTTDITEAILNNYGGVDANSLKHLFESQFTEQENINETPDMLNSSPYIENEQLLTLLSKNRHNLKIISLNCQSLNAKYEQLNLYLNSLLQNPFDIICLQETWLSESSNTQLLQLAGNKMINQPYKISSHGGLSIYIKENLKYKLIDLQHLLISSTNRIPSSVEDTNEKLFIEVSLPTKNTNGSDKKIIIGNIYRPPRDINENYVAFTNEMNIILDYFSRNNKDVILTGDFNIDLLKIKSKIVFQEYLDSLLTNGFLPKIIYPTRFFERGGTLIDNFFCKLNSPSTGEAGILLQNISDHLPYFFIFDVNENNSVKNKFITKRDINSHALKALKNDLKKCKH